MFVISTKSVVDREAKQEFDFSCTEISSRILDRLSAHEQILRSGAAFVEHAGFDRQEWHRFTARQRVEQELPGIQGFGFALLIPREGLARHVQEIRAEGFPEYQVRPEGDREIYSSIICLEPFTNRNLRAFGYDMLSEPVRRAAMELARDQDSAILSGKVILVQETDKDVQAGTLMYMPVYQREMPMATVEQRRAALLGWVYSPYRMNDLMQGILGGWDLNIPRRVHLEIFDDEGMSRETLLYDNLPATNQLMRTASELTSASRIPASGRQWTLRFTAVGLRPGMGYARVWLVLLGGTSTTLLFSGWFFSVLNNRYRAQQMAAGLMKELGRSEQRYSSLLNDMLEGFAYCRMVFDDCGNPTNFTYLKVNIAFERLTGLRGVVGKTVTEVLPNIGRSNPELFEIYGRVVNTGTSEKFETYLPGMERWFAISVTSAGEGCFAAIFDDITARKQAVEALREGESRFQALLAQSVVGVAQVETGTGRFVRANQRFCDMLGYTLEEVQEMTYMAITHPEDLSSSLENMQRFASGNVKQMGLEKRYLRKDRSILWGNLTMLPLWKEGGKHDFHFSLVEDITEKRQLAERLRQSQKMEGIGQLAAGMAHEFNNILAAMGLNLNLVKKHSQNAEDGDLLGEIEGLSKRAAEIIRQLMAFSRQSVMRVQPMDLATVVSRQCNLLGRLLGEGITLEFSYPDRLPWVIADQSTIEQVLLNLCLNARDAMKNAGQIRLQLEETEVGAEKAAAHDGVLPGNYVCLTVTDTGCGMDAGTLKRLFEPFFTTKDIGQGTGLGLATVRGIIQQHHGWVEVQSCLGVGSTFQIYLPAVAQPVIAPPSPEQKTLVRGTGMILVIEDEPILRKATRMLFVRMGYSVLEAANGKEALNLWAKHQAEIDLIYTDMMMPGDLTGLQIVEKGLADKPGVKAIITSGYHADQVDLSLLADLSIVYLPKPCAAATLTAVIQKCLQRG